MSCTPGCRNNGETVQADQGWSPQQREAWYFATQGSRLMPRAWFDALERADADQPFGDIDHLSRFGFLPPPDGSDRILPIGFANDRQPDADFRVTGLRWYEGQRAEGEAVEPWLGLNCAACHTARMRHDGVDYTIDGGPSLSISRASSRIWTRPCTPPALMRANGTVSPGPSWRTATRMPTATCWRRPLTSCWHGRI